MGVEAALTSQMTQMYVLYASQMYVLYASQMYEIALQQGKVKHIQH
jgi:hypothetical protein